MQLWNEMLVAHLCQRGLVLFSQVYKWVLVPWMGNSSATSPLLSLGEWYSCCYLHFLLLSHLFQEGPGQGKVFVYFLLCCSTGWIFPAVPHLHWAHQELSAWRLPDVQTVWAPVWASTGIHLSGLCGYVWRRCSSRQQRPPLGMQATVKCWSLLFPFTGCSFWSAVLALLMHEYKTVTKM